MPLCTRQPASAQVETLASNFSFVVWWAAAVELHSAIARLHRLREVNDAGKQFAIEALKELGRTWREIAPSRELREQAQTCFTLMPCAPPIAYNWLPP
jgi:hypothetical protein